MTVRRRRSTECNGQRRGRDQQMGKGNSKVGCQAVGTFESNMHPSDFNAHAPMAEWPDAEVTIFSFFGVNRSDHQPP